MATVEMKVRPEDLTSVPQGHERIPDPGIMVIFGASGDLTKRKLLPALFHLEQSGLLPKKFAIVGVARRPLGNEFAEDMRAGIVESGVDNNDPKLEEFVEEDQLLCAELRRCLALRGSESGAGPDRGRKRASGRTGSSISQLRRSTSSPSSRTWARRAWRSRSTGAWAW